MRIALIFFSAVIVAGFLSACSGSKPLRGTIRDRVAYKNGISEVEVYIAYADSQYTIADCYTNENGAFEFGKSQTKQAKPDFRYKLFCKKEGILSPTQLGDSSLSGRTIRSGLGERKDLLFMVDFGGQIIGKLVDEKGQPIYSGGTVTWWKGVIDFSSGTGMTEPIGFDGRFSLKIESNQLTDPNDTFSLLIRCVGYRPEGYEDISVLRGHTKDLGYLKLTPLTSVDSGSLDLEEITKPLIIRKDPGIFR